MHLKKKCDVFGKWKMHTAGIFNVSRAVLYAAEFITKKKLIKISINSYFVQNGKVMQIIYQ